MKLNGVIFLLSLVLGSFGGYKFRDSRIPKVIPASSNQSTARKKTKKTIPQAGGLPPIVEEIEEEINSNSLLLVPANKDYILGLTLSYDQKVNYHIALGKRVTDDCYAIAKATTDLQANKIEAGAACLF